MSKEVIETPIEIMGRTFHIKCPSCDIAALQKAAKFLEQKLRLTREASQTLSFEKVAVITALNISHELLNIEQNKNHLSELVNDKLRDLKNKVEAALSRHKQMELQPAE